MILDVLTTVIVLGGLYYIFKHDDNDTDPNLQTS